MKIDLYPLNIVCFGIYSLFYGGYCYYVYGMNGLLLASIFYVFAGIIGVINKKRKK